jgi:SPP1 family predicted phage head-tail adaptor
VTAYRIGALRHRLTLESAARTPDGGGGASESWIAVADIWAAIIPRSGSERTSAEAIRGDITHEVWIRYRSDVVPAMRFRQDARVFHIAAVMDAGGRRRRLKCLCEERDL